MDEELVTTLPAEELKLIIKRVEKGMKKKLHACEEGLQMGLKEAVIASGLRENPVRSAKENKECTTIS